MMTASPGRGTTKQENARDGLEGGAQVTQGGAEGTGSAAKSAKGPEAPADPETCEGQGYDGPLGASQGARLLGSEGGDGLGGMGDGAR